MNQIATDKLNKKGKSRFKILSEIRKSTKIDLNYKDGSILGSMCTTAPKIALKVFNKYTDVNLGDSGLFKGSLSVEKRAISMLGNLLHQTKAEGVYLTGGTEANIVAIKNALLLHLTKFPNSKREELNLIVPKSAHFSFDKAAELMGFNLVKITLDEEYKMDFNLMKKAVDKNCFAIVGVAGTTALGVIDPIEKISDYCFKNSIYLHIDAAFGGFVIPFMDSTFKNSNKFDFKLKGVKSISIDPHKMGRGVTPGGVIIYKNRDIIKSTIDKISYLAGGKTEHLTMVGTRSGSAVLACYASMVNLGIDGFKKNVNKTLEVTNFLVDSLEKMEGYSLIIEPTINVVGIVPNFCTPLELGAKLREEGIAVSVFDTFIRVVIMPHLTKKKIKQFCKVLNMLYNKNGANNG